jgi:hypothetical protein
MERMSRRHIRDSIKVARFQGYEPFYLARKFQLTIAAARALIKRVGKDRVKLNSAAKRLARRLAMIHVPTPPPGIDASRIEAEVRSQP